MLPAADPGDRVTQPPAKRNSAVTGSDLATAASWSYGLAAACYAVFAIRLAIGWRGDLRATLLIVATIATTLWAASNIFVVLSAVSTAWLVANAFDALRYGAWFAFLGYLLKGPTAEEPKAAFLSAPVVRWTIVFVLPGLAASVALSEGLLPALMLGASGRTAEYTLRLGLAIFGLILVEQLLRRAHPQARWGLKPLCVGLAGVFAFDIFFYAEAMMFGRLDASIFVARGFANALIIPFVAMATVRNTGWTIDLHMSQGGGVPNDGLAGVGHVPARGRGSRLFCPLSGRRLGPGAADRVAVRRPVVRSPGGIVRQVPVENQGFRQQEFLLLSLRLSQGVAPLHAHPVGGVVRPESAGALHRSPRESRRKPGRRVVATSRKRRLSARIAVEHGSGRCRRGRAGERPAGGVPRTQWLGHRSARIRVGSCGLPGVDATRLAGVDAGRMADRSSRVRYRTGRVCRF